MSPAGNGEYDAEALAEIRNYRAQEAYEDFSGRQRLFDVSILEIPAGFRAEAVECDREDADGFVFRTYHPTAPHIALGELRDSIRRFLATKHLTEHKALGMTHEILRGRFDWSDRLQGVCAVIDGKALSFEELAQLLSTYEGHYFKLEVFGMANEVS